MDEFKKKKVGIHSVHSLYLTRPTCCAKAVIREDMPVLEVGGGRVGGREEQGGCCSTQKRAKAKLLQCDLI